MCRLVKNFLWALGVMALGVAALGLLFVVLWAVTSVLIKLPFLVAFASLLVGCAAITAVIVTVMDL